MFLILHSINWANFNVLLPALLEILGNMYVEIVCFPNSYVTNFEINLIFLIKSFFYMTKKSRQKFKYLGNKKSLYSETRFFISFKGLSIANNCLRPYSAPLRISSVNASISADKIRKILEQSGKLAKTRR